MSKFKVIRGSDEDESSNTGGTRTPVIAVDSLHSVAHLKILDLLCEGEIVGLVRGSKSVFLNNTRLQNVNDGSYNFKGVTWEQRVGTQNQSYISNASGTEREITVGAQFKYGEPSSGDQPSYLEQPGTAIIRTILDPDVNKVRVRLSVPQLLATDVKTGDVSGAEVGYTVEIKANNWGAYIPYISEVIKGKTTTKYEWSREIPLVGGNAPWLVRVSRFSGDAANNYYQNSTYWESYTEITDAKLSYPNSALIGIKIDATQFSSVPARSYEVDLLKIRIPTNYNDVTRAYTGTWDGTFKISTGACSNPAWVFYDLLTNSRYGLGDHIDTSQINKWKLYEIARYCDELVPSGFNTYEPRFTCNVFIPGRTGAYELIKSMTSVFRGMAYWAGGAITASQDSPKDPVYLYNQSNVIDGKFTYQGSSIQTRHTVAKVAWNDPNNFYQQTIEFVEDEESVRKYGVIETDVIAFGCTSRGQAHRLGKWLLYTEKYESEVCSWATGLEGVQCAPGDIVQVSDPLRAGLRMGGRVSTATTTVVTIDSDFDTSTTGTISVLLPNGTVEERTIASIVGRQVTVTSAFTTAPQSQSVWVISSSTVEVQPYKVVGVLENDSGTYTITALKHYPSKFDFIDYNTQLDELDTSDLTAAPTAPKNLIVNESLYSVSNAVKVRATFSWDQVPLAGNYKVSYIYNGGSVITLPVTQFTEIDVNDIQPGSYEFRVLAINSLGVVSPESSTTFEVRGKTLPPTDVQNFSMIPSQSNALLSWDRATDLDVLVGGYIRIRWTPKTTDQLWQDAVDILPAITGNSTQIVAPLLAGTYMAKFVDSSDNYSVNEKLVVTDVADVYALNVIQTITEDPDFGGTLDNMLYIPEESSITLTSNALMDDVPDIDALGTWDFFGDIVDTGEYLFQDSLNLGGIWPFKVRASIDLEAFDNGNFIDTRLDLIDTWESFDGDVINALNAKVMMRTTRDDPAGTPTWSEWKQVINAEYTAWGAEFKLVCENDQPNHNLWIRHLSVTIDMVDRTWNSGKLTSSTGGNLWVDFANDFYITPSIGITELNGITGDYKTITGLDKTGFYISFYNAAGTRVARDFYVLAKAYGAKLT